MTTKDYRTKGSLRIFFSYFKPHLRLFLLDMLCALLVAAIDLAFPLVSRQALYTWLPDRAYRVFFLAMGVVVAAYVLRSVLNYVICYWGHTFGIRVEADIRRDLFTHMQDLGFDFYDRNRTGQLMSRLTSDLFDLTELAHHGPEDVAAGPSLPGVLPGHGGGGGGLCAAQCAQLCDLLLGSHLWHPGGSGHPPRSLHPYAGFGL